MRLNQGWRALVLLVSVTLCAAVPAAAQTITRWTLRVYQVGAPQPLLKPIDLVLGEDVMCNLDPATVDAARKDLFLTAVWNDPTAIEKVCVWVDPGTGPLLSSSLAGSYRGDPDGFERHCHEPRIGPGAVNHSRHHQSNPYRRPAP